MKVLVGVVIAYLLFAVLLALPQNDVLVIGGALAYVLYKA